MCFPPLFCRLIPTTSVLSSLQFKVFLALVFKYNACKRNNKLGFHCPNMWRKVKYNYCLRLFQTQIQAWELEIISYATNKISCCICCGTITSNDYFYIRNRKLYNGKCLLLIHIMPHKRGLSNTKHWIYAVMRVQLYGLATLSTWNENMIPSEQGFSGPQNHSRYGEQSILTSLLGFEIWLCNL